MKKSILLTSLYLSLLSSAAIAQAPFPTIDFVSVNNIKAAVLLHGDMFWNPAAQVPQCEYPSGSGKHINFTSALWMSGFDGGGQLHVASQTYRQDGNDYWPGPLDGADTLTYGTSFAWAKIWKVNRSEIEYFQKLTAPTITTTPSSILSWPGKGNAHARGNALTPLTVTDDMAPFVDLNGNGIYEPLLGEYPDVNGDQALWWVFSDNGPSHSNSNGSPVGAEIHALAYAYNRGTLIDNVVYFDYTIKNKSANNYSNFRFGLFDDVDLGYYLDDYIGFDSSHRMGIAYGATNDDGGAAGHPSNSYGTMMPMVGITMVVLPGDAGTSYVPAGSFTYYNNDLSIIGNPSSDAQYDNYLRSRIRSGAHFTKDYTGPGVPSACHGSGPDCNYVYTGDPSDSLGWSECACHNIPGDRRFIISSNDFTLNAGSTQHVVMALVATPLDTTNGCGGGASFTRVKTLADTAWHIYHNPLLPSAVADHNRNSAISIYPNPAHDKLFIENTGTITGAETITLLNAIGQKIDLPVSKSGAKTEINISTLPAGMYIVLYRSENGQTVSKFLKE